MDKENDMNVLNVSIDSVSSADIFNSTFDTDSLGEISAAVNTFEILDFLNLRQILLLFIKSNFPPPFPKAIVI